jgi:hypothetical protein
MNRRFCLSIFLSSILLHDFQQWDPLEAKPTSEKGEP